MSSYVTINEGTDKKIGVLEKTEDSNSIEIQRYQYAYALIEFQKVLDATTLSGAESFWFDCNGLDKVVLKLMFESTSDTSVNIRIKYQDYNNEVVYSDEYTIDNTSILDTNSNYYIGENFEIDVREFNKVAVRITGSLSNDIVGYIGGISDGVEVTKGYVFGGYDGSNLLKDTDEYNNQSDSWTSKTDTPSPSRMTHTANYILDKIYIYCGNAPSTSDQPTKDTDEYNNQANTWTSKTDAPSPTRRNLSTGTSTIINKGYIYCGYDDTTTSGLKDTDEYNPDTWTSKTDAPSPARYLYATFDINNYGYIVGGRTYSGVFLKNTDEYNPDTWTSKTDAPSPSREYFTGICIIQKGYIFCGYNGTTQLKDTDEYTPDTWASKTDAPSPARWLLSASHICNKAYIYSGRDSSNQLRDTDEYNQDTWTSKNNTASPARDRSAATSI